MLAIPTSVKVTIDEDTREVSFYPLYDMEKNDETMVMLSSTLMESIITFDVARFPFDNLLRLDAYRHKGIINVRDVYDILSMDIIDNILLAGSNNKSGISRHIYNLWCIVYKELINNGITSMIEIESIKSKFKQEFIYTYFCSLYYIATSLTYSDMLDTLLINKINWMLYNTEEFDNGFRKMLRNVVKTISKYNHTTFSNNLIKNVYCSKEYKHMLPACIEPLYMYDTIIFGHSNNKDTTEWITRIPLSKHQYCRNSTYETYVGEYTKVSDMINEQSIDNKVLVCLCNYCDQPKIEAPARLCLYIRYSDLPQSVVISEFRTSE